MISKYRCHHEMKSCAILIRRDEFSNNCHGAAFGQYGIKYEVFLTELETATNITVLLA